MAYSLKIPGAVFTKIVEEEIPSYSQLDMFLLLGGTEAASKKNYAGTHSPATAVGTPVYSSGYCTLTSANGFEAPMTAGNSPFTHIGVISQASSGTPGYFGNWTAGNTANLLLDSGSTDVIQLAIDSNIRLSSTLPSSGFRFVACTHDGTTAAFHKGSAGVLAKDTGAYSGGEASTSKFRIGGSGFSAGTFTAAAVMTADEVLTDSAILELYQYLTTVLAARGVTVV